MGMELDKWLLSPYRVTFTFQSFRELVKVVVLIKAYGCHHAVALATIAGMADFEEIDTDCILVDAQPERIDE